MMAPTETLVRNGFGLLMNKEFKAIYVFVFAFLTIVYIVFCLMLDKLFLGVLFSIVAAVDLAGVIGYAFRKPIGKRIFWKAWYIWSLLFFFYDGFGHDAFGVTDISITQIIRVLYYVAFFGMLYVYAFIDPKPWVK